MAQSVIFAPVKTVSETPTIKASPGAIPAASPAKARLQAASLKVTRPRLALLKVLMAEHGPFTMEELHQRISDEKAAQCDLATVYRCLDSFQKANLVRRCDFGDGPVRFEYFDEDEAHHHHVVCRRCGEVRTLEHCLVEDIERVIAKQGYAQITHSLEFFGVCERCQQAP